MTSFAFSLRETRMVKHSLVESSTTVTSQYLRQ